MDTALVYIQEPRQQEPAITPGSPLAAGDFLVAGLKSGMDSIAVRQLLGVPDSISGTHDSRDPGASLISWHYRDLVVQLGSYNSVGAVEIVGPGVATARGLRVGDAQARVAELYGTSCALGASECQYEYPGDPEGLTVVVVDFAQEKVTRIYVGHLYD